MKTLLILLACSLLSACLSLQWVSPYDPVIDSGLKEYREQINTLVKNIAAKGGTPKGTYEANIEAYNALESKIEMLIDRASIQSNGRGCKLSDEINERVSAIMGVQAPANIEAGDSMGCTQQLLVMVKYQLDKTLLIHKTTDLCVSKEDANQSLSCLRKATAKSVLAITNQSINAAWVVETAKKVEGES